jgi:hypothetical protein
MGPALLAATDDDNRTSPLEGKMLKVSQLYKCHIEMHSSLIVDFEQLG